MSFLYPAMLAGLFGATVPIIIHLIHKRKPREQKFAAIELLLRSIQRVERRWRLKRILLLASRVLVLAALSFAAARPLLGDKARAVATARGPQRIGIVIDASLSMRARYGRDRTAFERAVELANALVDQMGPEDQAVVVTARAKPELVKPKPTASRAELKAALASIQPTYEAAELADAVTSAAAALVVPVDPAAPANAPAPEASPIRVVVFSDLAGHGIRNAADLAVGPGQRAALELVPVVADVDVGKRNNRAITELAVSSAPSRVAQTIEARARIRAFTSERTPSTDPKPVEVTLRGPGGDLYAGSAEVVLGTVVDKTMTHTFPAAGYVPISVALEPDVLAEDDVRFALADVRRDVRTVIVDGAPSGVPKEDEVFYLERALAAGAPDQPAPRVVTVDDFARTDLSGFDVLILAGVTSLPDEDAVRVVDFAEGGGGVWITAAAGMDLAKYNTSLGRILPRKLRDVRHADTGRDTVGSSGVVSLGAFATDHPVMELFRGEAESGLKSARTRGYLILEPEREKAATVLAAYEDGQPALIEAAAGRGKVVLLTTSIDRDMSDLPIRPAFLPLVRRLVLHLGNALARPDARLTLVGQTRTIQLPQGATSLEILAPDGKTTPWQASTGEQLAQMPFTDTRVPGHYTVRAGTSAGLERLPSEDFAVNVDTAESDLRQLTVEEATAVLLGTPSGDTAASTSTFARLTSGGLSNPELIAAWLLLVMFIAFVAESALTAQKPQPKR